MTRRSRGEGGVSLGSWASNSRIDLGFHQQLEAVSNWSVPSSRVNQEVTVFPKMRSVEIKVPSHILMVLVLTGNTNHII